MAGSVISPLYPEGLQALRYYRSPEPAGVTPGSRILPTQSAIVRCRHMVFGAFASIRFGSAHPSRAHAVDPYSLSTAEYDVSI
jgi:hypothetical protein